MRCSSDDLAGLSWAALSLLVLLGCQHAAAGVLPKTYHVGAVGLGSTCDFSSIQSAIAASTTAGDVIVIDGGLVYSAQHLTIYNQSLTIKAGPCQPIIGGLPSAPAANARVTISGNDNAAGPVFTIGGIGSVTLIDLNITQNHSSNDGGGIAYAGSGTLTLNNVLVSYNQAANGGGIDFNGTDSGVQAHLVTQSDTAITSNTALQSGGGVRLRGNALLTMSASGNLIDHNDATNGYGGGIAVIAPAEADIGSHGASGEPAVWHNTAQKGGGIAVIALAGQSDASVYALAADPAYPVGIVDNQATFDGGGVYLAPLTTSAARFIAGNYRIEDNTAADGSAIFVEGTLATGQGYVSLEDDCAAGIECNSIAGNIAESKSVPPVPGTILALNDGTQFFASGARLHGNQGLHAASIGEGADVTFSGCLVVENAVSADLFTATNGNLHIRQSTIANNAIAGAHVIGANVSTEIADSIFGESVPALSLSGGILTIQNVVAANAGGLPGAPDVVQADPRFVDVVHSDYHLRAVAIGTFVDASPAIDFAAANGGGNDLDLHPRDRDVPLVVDRFGVRDLGVYEMQPITDRLFGEGMGDGISLVF